MDVIAIWLRECDDNADADEDDDDSESANDNNNNEPHLRMLSKGIGLGAGGDACERQSEYISQDKGLSVQQSNSVNSYRYTITHCDEK